MVFSVHLQRAAVVAIVDCADRGQFIGLRSLKKAAPQWIWLVQVSLHSGCPSYATGSHMGIHDGKLSVMVCPVRLLGLAVVAIRDCPARGKFIRSLWPK